MRGERNFHWSRTALLSRRDGSGESSYKSQGCAICAAVSNVPGLPARFPLLSFATSLLLPILFQDIVEALYLLFAIFQRQRLVASFTGTLTSFPSRRSFATFCSC